MTFIHILRRELHYASATPLSWLMPLLTMVTINFLMAYTIKPYLGGQLEALPEISATAIIVSLMLTIITSAVLFYSPHPDQGRKLAHVLLLPASATTFMGAKIIVTFLMWWGPLLLTLPVLGSWWGINISILYPYVWRVVLVAPAISGIVNLLSLLTLNHSRASQLMYILLPPLLLPFLILILSKASLTLIGGITMCMLPLTLAISSSIYRDTTSMLG